MHEKKNFKEQLISFIVSVITCLDSMAMKIRIKGVGKGNECEARSETNLTELIPICVAGRPRDMISTDQYIKRKS